MGSTYPRVSAILEAAGLGPDYSHVPNDGRLERAAQRGTDHHALVAAHHYGYLEADQVAAPAYLAFLEESGHEPIISEFEVVSDRWRYVGHPDRVGVMSRRRGLFDWKFIEHLDVLPAQRQLAGYKLAWDEQHPDQPIAFCAAVQFLLTGRYKFHEFTRDEMALAENEFLAAVVCYHARGRKA